jgi:hypothetical protein
MALLSKPESKQRL